jgi:hypothetical protein
MLYAAGARWLRSIAERSQVAARNELFGGQNVRRRGTMRVAAVVVSALTLTALAASDPHPLGAGTGFPAASPKATLSQRLGFGRVDVEYSRPRVRGREIWGALVPYGEVWRTGADYPTFFTTAEDIRVEEQPLAAGRYALYTVPGREAWTIVFSRETELWGAFGYRADHDALRVEVRPRAAPFTESFTIELAEVGVDRATLLLRWADLEVPVRLRAEVMERVAADLETAEAEDWGAYWRAARVALEVGGDLAAARDWIARSLAIERNWMNLWTAAGLAAAAGDRAGAVRWGTEALELCAAAQPYCAYRDTYRKQIDAWSRPARAPGPELRPPDADDGRAGP